VTYILHLETSTKVCSVALSKNGSCVDFITEFSEDFVHSERLNILISELLNGAHVAFSDLSAVSVSSGPGSYTGLRIGVSTAKGLSYALSIPLIDVDSLSALAYWAKSEIQLDGALIMSMIDARRMEAYTALFDSNLHAIKPVSADIFDADYLTELNPNQKVLFVGDAQEKCKPIWQHRENFVFSDIQADARGQIEPAFQRFQNADFADLVYFEPQYFKDFQPGIKAK
jgi:tRNA threonylcarbamoyladenosine biosynthesis protein TsaB